MLELYAIKVQKEDSLRTNPVTTIGRDIGNKTTELCVLESAGKKVSARG
jgi:hypothetical protein